MPRTGADRRRACAGPRASRPSSSCPRRSARAARRPRPRRPRSRRRRRPDLAVATCGHRGRWMTTSVAVGLVMGVADDATARRDARGAVSRRRGRRAAVGQADVAAGARVGIGLERRVVELGVRPPAPARRARGRTRWPLAARRRARPASESSHLCSSTSQYAWTGSRSGPMAGAQPRERRLEDLGAASARRPRAPADRALLEPLEPGPVLAQVVEQQARLALERAGARSGARARGRGSGGSSTATRSRSSPAPVAGLELDLVDREAEVVEPADAGRGPRADRRRARLGLGVQLVPERRRSGRARSRRRRSPRRCRRPALQRARGRPARRRRSRRGSRGRRRAGRRTAPGGPRSSRRRRGRPGSGRRRAGTACSRASSRPSRRRRGGGRRGATPSRPAAGRGTAPGPSGKPHEQAAVLERVVEVLGHEDRRCSRRAPRRGRSGRPPAGPAASRWRRTSYSRPGDARSAPP